MKFGYQLRQLRKNKHLSTTKLGAKAKIDPSTIAKIERGVRKPKPSTLNKLAHGLRIPYARILSMAGIMKMPENLITPKGYARIPVVGAIACGDPNLAIPETDHYKLVPADQPHKDYVFLRANGHSMEPQIKDGSLVKIHLQPDVDNLQIAAVSVNEEDATLKQVIKKNGKIDRFHPFNPAFGDVYPTINNDCRIIGKAVEVDNPL